MPTYSNRGALPHRTVAPRPGELIGNGRAVHDAPLTPLLYVDAKTYLPEHVPVVCPACGLISVHIVGLGIVRRDDYSVVSRVPIREWEGNRSTRWMRASLNEKVRFDSLVLELECEHGHATILELGAHKAFLSARVTRLRPTGPFFEETNE